MGISAVASLALLNPTSPEDSTRNKWAKALKQIATSFGNSRVQFFVAFVLALLFYVDSQSTYFLVLFLFLAFVLLDPWRLFFRIASTFRNKKPRGIGRIFGVQSKYLFLVKLFDDAPSVAEFDFVEFRHSMNDHNGVQRGLILDTCLLNQEQWVKVLVCPEIQQIFPNEPDNDGYDADAVFKIDAPNGNGYLAKFVGTIYENSTISTIRFIYSSRVEIFDGQLLEVEISGKKILYQVVQGITKIELLEQKNETGYIIGEAIQLGMWKQAEGKFEKYGWVPSINSPVYIASEIAETNTTDKEYVLGRVPNSNFPVILNRDVALSHHTAVIGVTGTGKSVFARNLIREYLSDPDVKVICIDFTGEYIGKFPDINPGCLLSKEAEEQCFRDLDKMEQERAKGFKADEDFVKQKRDEVWKCVRDGASNFLQGEPQLAILELPDVFNSPGILEYTRMLFWAILDIAKKEGSFGKKVCLVLEEAHTIVPEWNFAGVSDKVSGPVLNSIAQIALQGRKYNVGLLVIAQRTANVSKTILTQCNTIVSFQVFDRTSSEFLANYFGQVIIEALPNLKSRQAIVAGKAIRSVVPMIFEVPDIQEPAAVEPVQPAASSDASATPTSGPV